LRRFSRLFELSAGVDSDAAIPAHPRPLAVQGSTIYRVRIFFVPHWVLRKFL